MSDGNRQTDLKVGLICHRGIGGSVRIALELGTELARRGCTVHVFARSAPMGLRQLPGISLHTLVRNPADHIVSTELDLTWADDEIEALIALILSVETAEHLDVLHFHYAIPFAEVVDRIRHRAPDRRPLLVGTLHGTDVGMFDQRPTQQAALAATLRRLDAVTTVSRHQAMLAQRKFALDTAPQVIANFIDTQRFRPAGETAQPGRRPMIMHVSNFRPVKQPDSMARIFLNVRSRMEVKLGLIGGGPGMPAVTARLEQAGYADDICCFGIRTAVEDLLAEAQLLVVTSREESFCLVALEAAASGIPVIAPRLGGLPDIVVDGQTGILFEPGDERQASDAVLRTLGDPVLRKAMGRAARELARQFDTGVVVAQYFALYRRLLAHRPP